MTDPEKFLIEQLPLIEQRIASIGYRAGMDADEIDEFAAEVRFRLVSNDYAVLRKFKGRSSFATYISAAIANLLLDYRNHQWGKWRPSAEAERLGPLAVDLERRLYRDDTPFDEAFADMSRETHDLVRADVEALAARLPQRLRRRRVALDAAAAVAASDHTSSAESAETGRNISSAIATHIKTLAEDDRLLLRLRFDAEMTVSQIAHIRHVDPQSLFRRLYKLFHELRVVLERAGINAQDVMELIGKDEVPLDFRLKSTGDCPSQNNESEAAGRNKEKP